MRIRANGLSLCRMKTAAAKPPRKQKLTDPERHARFVEMAKKVEASEDIADFDRAFRAVAKPPKRQTPQSNS